MIVTSGDHRGAVTGPLLLEASASTVRRMAVDVCAHITGTVWKIVVEVGQQVEEDAELVILESMKMEMPVNAPDAGTVEQIVVEEGQAVEEGDVLVKLAP